MNQHRCQSETDADLWMHAVRLMRSGRFQTAKELLSEIERAFPAIPPAEVKESLGRLAGRLRENA